MMTNLVARSLLWDAEEAPAPSRPAPTIDPALDAELIAILDAPLAPGETVRVGYDRKEQALGAHLAALTVPEARALLARITMPRASDVLVEKLGRLTADRRARLCAFLADARRRAAFAR